VYLPTDAVMVRHQIHPGQKLTMLVLILDSWKCVGVNRRRWLQLLHRDMQRFRGGLVFKVHRLCVSLNSRLENDKEEEGGCGAATPATPAPECGNEQAAAGVPTQEHVHSLTAACSLNRLLCGMNRLLRGDVWE